MWIYRGIAPKGDLMDAKPKRKRKSRASGVYTGCVSPKDLHINDTDDAKEYRRRSIEALRAKEAAWGQKRRVA